MGQLMRCGVNGSGGVVYPASNSLHQNNVEKCAAPAALGSDSGLHPQRCRAGLTCAAPPALREICSAKRIGMNCRRWMETTKRRE
jgi:hypothetical protein